VEAVVVALAQTLMIELVVKAVVELLLLAMLAHKKLMVAL
jgi:hypothetical protein